MSTEHGSHLPRSVDENQLDADGLLRRIRLSPPYCSNIGSSAVGVKLQSLLPRHHRKRLRELLLFEMRCLDARYDCEIDSEAEWPLFLLSLLFPPPNGDPSFDQHRVQLSRWSCAISAILTLT